MICTASFSSLIWNKGIDYLFVGAPFGNSPSIILSTVVRSVGAPDPCFVWSFLITRRKGMPHGSLSISTRRASQHCLFLCLMAFRSTFLASFYLFSSSCASGRLLSRAPWAFLHCFIQQFLSPEIHTRLISVV